MPHPTRSETNSSQSPWLCTVSKGHALKMSRSRPGGPMGRPLVLVLGLLLTLGALPSHKNGCQGRSMQAMSRGEESDADNIYRPTTIERDSPTYRDQQGGQAKLSRARTKCIGGTKLTYPGSNTQYLWCNFGRFVLMHCPRGTIFCPHINVCCFGGMEHSDPNMYRDAVSLIWRQQLHSLDEANEVDSPVGYPEEKELMGSPTGLFTGNEDQVHAEAIEYSKEVPLSPLAMVLARGFLKRYRDQQKWLTRSQEVSKSQGQSGESSNVRRYGSRRSQGPLASQIVTSSPARFPFSRRRSGAKSRETETVTEPIVSAGDNSVEISSGSHEALRTTNSRAAADRATSQKRRPSQGHVTHSGDPQDGTNVNTDTDGADSFKEMNSDPHLAGEDRSTKALEPDIDKIKEGMVRSLEVNNLTPQGADPGESAGQMLGIGELIDIERADGEAEFGDTHRVLQGESGTGRGIASGLSNTSMETPDLTPDLLGAQQLTSDTHLPRVIPRKTDPDELDTASHMHPEGRDALEALQPERTSPEDFGMNPESGTPTTEPFLNINNGIISRDAVSMKASSDEHVTDVKARTSNPGQSLGMYPASGHTTMAASGSVPEVTIASIAPMNVHDALVRSRPDSVVVLSETAAVLGEAVYEEDLDSPTGGARDEASVTATRGSARSSAADTEQTRGEDGRQRQSVLSSTGGNVQQIKEEELLMESHEDDHQPDEEYEEGPQEIKTRDGLSSMEPEQQRSESPMVGIKQRLSHTRTDGEQFSETAEQEQPDRSSQESEEQDDEATTGDNISRFPNSVSNGEGEQHDLSMWSEYEPSFTADKDYNYDPSSGPDEEHGRMEGQDNAQTSINGLSSTEAIVVAGMETMAASNDLAPQIGNQQSETAYLHETEPRDPQLGDDDMYDDGERDSREHTPVEREELRSIEHQMQHEDLPSPDQTTDQDDLGVGLGGADIMGERRDDTQSRDQDGSSLDDEHAVGSSRSGMEMAPASGSRVLQDPALPDPGPEGPPPPPPPPSDSLDAHHRDAGRVFDSSDGHIVQHPPLPDWSPVRPPSPPPVRPSTVQGDGDRDNAPYPSVPDTGPVQPPSPPPPPPSPLPAPSPHPAPVSPPPSPPPPPPSPPPPPPLPSPPPSSPHPAPVSPPPSPPPPPPPSSHPAPISLPPSPPPPSPHPSPVSHPPSPAPSPPPSSHSLHAPSPPPVSDVEDEAGTHSVLQDSGPPQPPDLAPPSPPTASSDQPAADPEDDDGVPFSNSAADESLEIPNQNAVDRASRFSTVPLPVIRKAIRSRTSSADVSRSPERFTAGQGSRLASRYPWDVTSHHTSGNPDPSDTDPDGNENSETYPEDRSPVALGQPIPISHSTETIPEQDQGDRILRQSNEQYPYLIPYGSQEPLFEIRGMNGETYLYSADSGGEQYDHSYEAYSNPGIMPPPPFMAHGPGAFPQGMMPPEMALLLMHGSKQELPPPVGLPRPIPTLYESGQNPTRGNEAERGLGESGASLFTAKQGVDYNDEQDEEGEGGVVGEPPSSRPPPLLPMGLGGFTPSLPDEGRNPLLHQPQFIPESQESLGLDRHQLDGSLAHGLINALEEQHHQWQSQEGANPDDIKIPNDNAGATAQGRREDDDDRSSWVGASSGRRHQPQLHPLRKTEGSLEDIPQPHDTGAEPLEPIYFNRQTDLDQRNGLDPDQIRNIPSESAQAIPTGEVRPYDPADRSMAPEERSINIILSQALRDRSGSSPTKSDLSEDRPDSDWTFFRPGKKKKRLNINIIFSKKK